MCFHESRTYDTHSRYIITFIYVVHLNFSSWIIDVFPKDVSQSDGDSMSSSRMEKFLVC
jgi:hypothetical protein